MIIDSHVHISYTDNPKTFPEIKEELFLNMKENKISHSVVIPDNVPNPQCADMDNVMAIVKGEPGLFMIGTLNISNIDGQSLAMIGELFKEKTIRGFKIFPGHDPVYPTDKRWYPVYELCIKYDFPLIIHTGINSGDRECAKYNDPKYIVEIAKLFPKLKIVIAHYFWPKLDHCYSMTGGFDNIYFDTSALADKEVLDESGGIEKMREILERTVARNPKSVLFGTDWPMCNVSDHIRLINSLAISQNEKEMIFSKNVIGLFQLKGARR